jgi:hypothetical protein
MSLLPPDMDLAERIDHIVYDELTAGQDFAASPSGS